MKKSLSLVLVALLASCGDDDGNGGTPDAAAAADARPADAANAFAQPAQIQSWMNGKTFVMTGANIPSHPNGINEDQNAGQATQCYVSVTMVGANNNLTVTSLLGTLEGAPNVLDIGTCNHTQQSGMVMFASNTVLIENVMGNAECFDITVTYTGFAQEGRGKISADAQTLTLELFFAGQATGHRCAAGAVGSSTVVRNGQPFTGNAQQVYTVQ
jgi:hypothetical protein